MAPTETQVQVAMGSCWLVLGLFWLYRSTIVASSTISLLFCVICCLAAGANAVVVYRRTALGQPAPQPDRAPGPGSDLAPAGEHAPEFTQVQPAPGFTRARWSASSAQPTPPKVSSPPSAPITSPLPEYSQATRAAPDPEPPPAPVWAPAPLVARAPQGRRPPPPVQLDPLVQPGPGSQPWPEPQFRPGAQREPEATPEPDPDLRWRRPRPGRS